jgi:vanillate/4-hydroxybenzoate decarboxylase subunit C
MPYDDLRQFLDRLELAGQLLRVETPVLPEPDLGAAGRAVSDLGPDAPALLFTDVYGFHGARIALNVHGSWPNHALMLDLPQSLGPREQLGALRERWKRFPVGAAERGDPPWRAHRVTGINLFTLLPVFRLNGTDGGSYIDTGCVISADPTAPGDFGRQNMGIYRLQVKGPDKLAVQAAPTHDLGRHMRLARERGDTHLPVAICVGNDPVLSFAASMPLAYDQSEYEMAGAFRGAPCPIARSPEHNLPVPWGCEFLLEGVINLDDLEYEGPFGEFTGHTTGGRRLPTVTVTSAHHRTDPIFEQVYIGVPWTETDYLVALNTCLPIQEQLAAEFPEVRTVNAMYTHGLVAIISVRPRAGGFARAVALRALTLPHGLGYCKLVIVVDDTVDPFNLPQVMWALSTKFNAAHDLITIPRMNVIPLDPSDDPPGLNTRVILDASTPVSPDLRGVPKHEVRPRPEATQWLRLLQDLRSGTPAPETPGPAAATAPLGPCPRCAAAATGVVAESPRPGLWLMYRCTTCWYTWRSTEPPGPVAREFRISAREVEAARDFT